MKRSIFIFFAMLLVIAGILGGATPVTANGENRAAQACKNGGWETFQDADGHLFKNQGQCVSYVVRGGQLNPVQSNPALSIYGGRSPYDPVPVPDGGLIGTGFTPGSTITTITYHYSVEVWTYVTGLLVGPDGTFDTGANRYWCGSYIAGGFPTVTFEVVSPVDGTYAQTFDLVSYCT